MTPDLYIPVKELPELKPIRVVLEKESFTMDIFNIKTIHLFGKFGFNFTTFNVYLKTDFSSN